MLKQMFILNRKSSSWKMKDNSTETPRPTLESHTSGDNVSVGGVVMSGDDSWSSPRTLRLLWAVVTIAFLCLLRIEEVLQIQAHHVFLDPEKDCFHLNLLFRKTAQTGGQSVRPITSCYYLCTLQELNHLCFGR